MKAKVYAVKVTGCTDCPCRHELANYCRIKIEELGPIELFEHIRDNTIHPDCPLPDNRETP